MLQVYVDYVVCEQDKKNARARIYLSTERGDKVKLSIEEEDSTKTELMKKYLAKYTDGMYSKEENKLVASSDYTGDMDGYTPYHLNYVEEYIAREFDRGGNSVSGYTIGSMNPIYGDKIKCTWTEVSCDIEDGGYCFVTIALNDDFGSFMDIYPGYIKGTDPNECVLEAMKEVAKLYYYNVEKGGYDIHEDGKKMTGTCYDIDLDFDRQEVLDLEFEHNEG